MEGRRMKCERLEKRCEKTKKTIKYCAWNTETEAFETVEKPAPCMEHALKCTNNKMEKPLHKGECGDCTESNICSNSINNRGNRRQHRQICGADGNQYENKCKFAVARCEAYKNDQTILFPESCRKQKMCNKLEGVCNNGTSKRDITYCAWNADNDEYETVTNGLACFMHCMKCSKPDEKHPLHKGECGNCTKANVCRKPSMMGHGHHHDSHDNGDDDENDSNDGNAHIQVHGGGKGGRWKGRGNKNSKRGRGGKNGGRKQPMGGKHRKIVCDTEGNVYNSMCDFAVARCEKYAQAKEELKPAKCPHSSGMY